MIDRSDAANLAILGLNADNLRRPSTLDKWFDQIVIGAWRVPLRHLAQLYDPSLRVTVDATYWERPPASKHYYNRTNHRGQTVEATKFVETDNKMILDGIVPPHEKEATQRYVRNSSAG